MIKRGMERRVQEHYCEEWDDMFINNTHPEFENCLCYEGPYPNDRRKATIDRRQS